MGNLEVIPYMVISVQSTAEYKTFYRHYCVSKVYECKQKSRFRGYYTSHTNSVADSDIFIIRYKSLSRIFNTLYGIITGPLSAKLSQAR